MKDWKLFEVAVERFVAAFDPRVTVRRDVRLPDRDTGRLRQRDVWVETKVCNLFPVKILVSCKRWTTKLDESDIDAFSGELRSSGAHKGVLYSAAGFTEPAILKAQVLGISCCRLYQNEPADIPESLRLAFYCCTTQYRLHVRTDGPEAWGDLPVMDILNQPLSSGDSNRTLLDELVRKFHEVESECAKELMKAQNRLRPWGVSAHVQGNPPLTLVVEGTWAVYRGKIEGYLLEGSYSFTEQQFIGAQSTPWIDTRSRHPGPHWELITDPPERLLAAGIGVIILSQGDLRGSLQENFGAKRIRDIWRPDRTND